MDSETMLPLLQIAYVERWCGWKGGVVRKHPPPSHVSSEGEGGGVVRKYPPPSRILSEGGGVVGKHPPSVSRFERGRVVVVVVVSSLPPHHGDGGNNVVWLWRVVVSSFPPRHGSAVHSPTLL